MMMGLALRDYVAANVASFSPTDRAQLTALSKWIGAGCQGTVTLQRDMPNVASAVVFIQTRLGNRFDFIGVVRLSGG